MKAQELKSKLKTAKIGKGCKFIVNSNCVTIVYQDYRLWSDSDTSLFSYHGSQKQKDTDFVKANFSSSNGLGTLVHSNKRSIQIYIN